MNLNLVQRTIKEETMWSDIKTLLQDVDLDFTGDNGEDYYTEEGVSQLKSAIMVARELECEQERIDYVIGKCGEYSHDYYSDFKYTIIPLENNAWEVVIATVSKDF